MDLVKGLFQLNGGAGYVLKPHILRDGMFAYYCLLLTVCVNVCLDL